MQKSTIPFLLTSFLFLLFSCASNPVQGLTPVKLEDKKYKSHYFSDRKIDYVYKTNVWVYGKQMSGIFVAKRINDKTHRVVLTTEFGNKLLDFEIGPEDHKVHSIVEELDRKMLVDVLVKDFQLLLREHFPLQQQFETDAAKVLQSKDGDQFNYIYLSKPDAKLTQIKHAGKRKEKITITYRSENNIFADNIVIQHHDIKLKMEFNHLKQQ